jgi:serine/threonine protein kinase
MMNHDEDRNLVTLTLPPGVVTGHAARTHAEDLIATLDLDAAPISIRERITLRGLHSSGGIGEVWRAYDEVLGREIALKRLKSDKAGSEANRARFLREARITGQLDHPGIVPVYDYSSNHDGTHCFYTMRFLRGRTLREVIAEFHRQRRAERLPLVGGGFLQLLGHFASICNTMAFAHSRQVIHRDLKGDNVIIGDFGEVVVLDWGLAKQLDADPHEDWGPALELDDLSASATLQGEQLGTPAYMAPEQALGEPVDHRADIYALGSVLYALLSGKPPFSAASLGLLVSKLVSSPPPPLPEKSLAGEPIPQGLRDVINRCLAKKPAQRFQSMRELAIALVDVETSLARASLTPAPTTRAEAPAPVVQGVLLDGRTTHDRPVPTPVQVTFRRTRPALLIVGGVLAVLALAGLGALFASREGPAAVSAQKAAGDAPLIAPAGPTVIQGTSSNDPDKPGGPAKRETSSRKKKR